jgi:hypothetical protein
VRDLSAAITSEIEAAFAFARQSPPPHGVADFVYFQKS